ncbi:hypothetical protein O6P43_018694 [Quillaja saponaria]|uniref:Uncharacterized protein n=1 Tax=Quillaja saponaria TaxID=32244 RepID=A0AAD7PJG5_QUISA|nr:hypothetical protein O6P43_018694 [Quillaja saponaria]
MAWNSGQCRQLSIRYYRIPSSHRVGLGTYQVPAQTGSGRFWAELVVLSTHVLDRMVVSTGGLRVYKVECAMAAGENPPVTPCRGHSRGRVPRYNLPMGCASGVRVVRSACEAILEYQIIVAVARIVHRPLELRKLVRRVWSSEQKSTTEENDRELNAARIGAKKSLIRFLQFLYEMNIDLL